jgi:hypothetical protein
LPDTKKPSGHRDALEPTFHLKAPDFRYRPPSYRSLHFAFNPMFIAT